MYCIWIICFQNYEVCMKYELYVRIVYSLDSRVMYVLYSLHYKFCIVILSTECH